MKEKWLKEWDDEIRYNNDANDYFTEWAELGEDSFLDLFKEWFGLDNGSGWDIPVRIKANKRAIFIVKKEVPCK